MQSVRVSGVSLAAGVRSTPIKLAHIYCQVGTLGYQNPSEVLKDTVRRLLLTHPSIYLKQLR